LVPAGKGDPLSAAANHAIIPAAAASRFDEESVKSGRMRKDGAVAEAGERYRVGDLVVDVGSAAVTRGGSPIPLPPLTLNLLLALVRRAPAVVRREELLDAVWPGEYVSDTALSQRVMLLRQALGLPPGQPRYVASSRGWGYRVVVPVEKLEPVEEPIRTIAVLPLVNLSGRPEEDYFADGITEALITSLSQVRALRVTSRTSAMCYRRSSKRLPEIARELGVQGIVEGGVLRDGGRVWVNAQLIHAGTDQHVWADKFEASASDLLSVLDQVAERVANAVDVALTPEERRRFAGRRTAVSADALEANLRGRYHAGRWTPADFDRAAEWYEEATRLDPAFAEPWAGLAYVTSLRASAFGGDLSAGQQRALMSRGKEAIERSLALDPCAAEACATQSLVALLHDWDWAAADDAADRALLLDPSCSLAHFHRALVAATTLDRKTAYGEAAVGIALDPLNLMLRTEHAEYAFWLRDYDRAVALARQALEFDAAYPRAHFLIGRVHERREEIEAAIESYKNAGMLAGDAAAEARAALAKGGVAGFHRWALHAGLSAHAGRQLASGDQVPLRAFFRARLHARLGHLDQAMTFLERAFGEHECLLTLLRAHEWWEPLHADPRFLDLVRRVGIPDRR
jgi:adenylate cyclase